MKTLIIVDLLNGSYWASYIEDDSKIETQTYQSVRSLRSAQGGIYGSLVLDGDYRDKTEELEKRYSDELKNNSEKLLGSVAYKESVRLVKEHIANSSYKGLPELDWGRAVKL